MLEAFLFDLILLVMGIHAIAGLAHVLIDRCGR